MADEDSAGMPAPELRARSARGFWQRLRGLLGHRAPPEGEALWIAPCRQVHTLGMRYPIDVLHLHADGRILAVATLKPWRLGGYHAAAAGVLELRAGEAERLGLRVGGRPRLIEP